MAGTVESQRIQHIPPYLFARIDKIKEEARRRGIDIIDLGIGDPDVGPPKAVIDTLVESARRGGTHHYSSYEGLPELRAAFADWFEKRYGIRLDPDREVLPLLGSKEGIGHIFLSLVNPGQEVLLPDPGYPVYAAGTVLAGGVPVFFPLREKNGFLPDIKELTLLVTQNTKMIWINYPSNPTAAVSDLENLQKVADFADHHGLILCHDAAYSEIVYNGNRSASILQTRGGKEKGIEFHSLSKTFCMPGWRVGFAAGNAAIIEALARVKTNLDSGIFLPIQEAAVTALCECEESVKEICALFESRCSRFVSGLREIGWNIPMPQATFYIWAPIPAGSSSMEFCAHILEKTGIVCTPGVGFGKHGEGFIRMSMTMPEDRLEEALDRFQGLKMKWGKEEVE
ncbi:MAG: LL-diaminopimelate aminotransferase [Syntrophales bacterium]|jgi:LL-diaminopimelate aminotransferase|nr:LL-diaminopimelate aminotransferase [Syntrophales bacterium]